MSSRISLRGKRRLIRDDTLRECPKVPFRIASQLYPYADHSSVSDEPSVESSGKHREKRGNAGDQHSLPVPTMFCASSILLYYVPRDTNIIILATFKPSTDDKILDWPKLKRIADDILKCV